MGYDFRWNEWNIEHVAAHGVTPAEAEFVVNAAKPPFPQDVGKRKSWVAGQTADGRYIQVIYIFSPDDVVFVIHARPLTNAEKRKLRRRFK